MDSSFGAAEAALQYMKEASRDHQNVADEPLTADEYSFREQIKKIDEFKQVVSQTRSPTKHHQRSIEDVSAHTNDGRFMHSFPQTNFFTTSPNCASLSNCIPTRIILQFIVRFKFLTLEILHDVSSQQPPECRTAF